MDIISNNLVEVSTDTIDTAFEDLFKAHFKALHAYAYAIVKDEIIAEEVVQSVFLRLWEKRSSLTVHTSIKAFLYRSVYNESLNYHKHQKVKSAYHQHQRYVRGNDSGDDSSNRVQMKDLEGRLELALNKLPEACRTIFQMSRFEELKYREIAEQLNISIKTVENQMGKALRILRLELVDFLPILFLIVNLFRL
ncbi:RNA polymerase sigma-70 factor [Albibacterium profundi]|uniref:RNA polymerase sigma-70 factor n=1 Tax=Albibacterium profundi TaxID=3134906 RepID=A0ABV5CBP1_9SPHI